MESKQHVNLESDGKFSQESFLDGIISSMVVEGRGGHGVCAHKSNKMETEESVVVLGVHHS